MEKNTSHLKFSDMMTIEQTLNRMLRQLEEGASADAEKFSAMINTMIYFLDKVITAVDKKNVQHTRHKANGEVTVERPA